MPRAAFTMLTTYTSHGAKSARLYKRIFSALISRRYFAVDFYWQYIIFAASHHDAQKGIIFAYIVLSLSSAELSAAADNLIRRIRSAGAYLFLLLIFLFSYFDGKYDRYLFYFSTANTTPFIVWPVHTAASILMSTLLLFTCFRMFIYP